MAKPPKAKNNDNKTAPEKATKALSPKRQLETDHLMGKHKATNRTEVQSMAVIQNECGFCQRRLVRVDKRDAATKRYLLANQK